MGIILFSRMSSSRLPGKALASLGPNTLLERVVLRARCLHLPIVLATSDDPSDDILSDAGRSLQLPVFRGALLDVADRACRAAKYFGFDAFVRLCGDRPFHPLQDMRNGLAVMAQSYAMGTPVDLVTTGYPRSVPPGLLTEVIRTEGLERLCMEAKEPKDREHVTSWFYLKAAEYRIYSLQSWLHDISGVRLAVDTERDRRLLSQVIETCPNPAISEHLAIRILRTLSPSQRASADD